MIKQNVTLKTHELEVIGQGSMPKQSSQVDDWYVWLFDEYPGQIPEEGLQKLADFKAFVKLTNTPVLGYLILDDMRDVAAKREKEAKERERIAEEQQRRKEEFDRAVQKTAEVGAVVMGALGTVMVGIAAGVAMLTVGIVGAFLQFDPVIVAVLPPDNEYPQGRWVSIYAWWE